jgi:hypothetical protein
MASETYMKSRQVRTWGPVAWSSQEQRRRTHAKIWYGVDERWCKATIATEPRPDPDDAAVRVTRAEVPRAFHVELFLHRRGDRRRLRWVG